MKIFKRLIAFNQVTGPLFKEMVIGLYKQYEKGTVLFTGSSEDLNANSDLIIKKAPKYNRSSKFLKLVSWIEFSVYSLLNIIYAKKNDLILITSNPPILGIIMYPIIKIKSLTYIFLIYDIYPEVLVKDKIFKSNSILIKTWHFLNEIVYKDSKLILTLSKSMRSYLKSKYDIKKIKVLPPWVDVNNIKPLDYNQNIYASEFVSKDKFVILYSGNMGTTHDIKTILKASNILKNNRELFFLLIGGGPGSEEVKNFIKKNKSTNIGLYPRQTSHKFKYTLPLSSLSIVSVKEGFGDLLIPSKAFYYLAAGSALIAISNKNNELSELVYKNNIGLVSSPGNAEELAISIQKIMKDHNKLKEMRENARELAINFYSKEKSIKRLLKIFNDSNLLGYSSQYNL